jgi:hypothetical protein
VSKTLTHLSLAAVLAATTTVTAAGPTIRTLAPDSTVIVAGADDVSSMMKSLKRTSLWELWQSEEVREMREEAEKAFEEAVTEMMGELGVDHDTMPMPQGGVGVAMFAVMDPETAMTGPGYMVVADFGAEADKTAELIAAAIAKAEEEGEVEYERIEVRGRPVLSFAIPDMEEEMADEAAGEEEEDPFAEFEQMDMMPGPEDALLGAIDAVHFVRAGDVFLWCTDLPALENGLAVCDDELDNAGLHARDDYRAVSRQIGEADSYAMVLTRNLPQLIAPMDPMGMSMMITPMLKQFVGEIGGVGMSFELDGESAMVEETVGVYMPSGRAGLTALLDTTSPRGEIPKFVGPDTFSYSTVNFEFAGLPETLRPIVQMAQMMMAAEAGGAPGPADDPMVLIEQVTSCFGRRVHVVQTGGDSTSQFVAVELVKPEEFEHLVATIAPELEGRDFLGHRLYTVEMNLLDMLPMEDMPGFEDMDMGAAEPPAIGIGAGHLFVGPTSAVEQAFRTASDDDAGSLEDETAFRRAIGVLSSRESVGWGFTDLAATIEAAAEEAKKQIERQRAIVAADDVEMDMAAEWFERFDPAILAKHLGPTAWELIPTDDGFVARSYLLSPPPAE